MYAEREVTEHVDEELQVEFETERTALREEAERHERDRLREFEALIESDLVDPEKLTRYAEIRRRSFEVGAEPPSLDDREREAEWREGQEELLNVRSRAFALKDFHPVPSVVISCFTSADTWTSPDPRFKGDADATATPLPSNNGFTFDLQASGFDFVEPLSASATGVGTIMFKIPGAHVPYGIVEVAPDVSYQGQCKVVGGLPEPWYPPGSGAWASIRVQSTLWQPSPPGKGYVAWTAPYVLWEDHAPSAAHQGWNVLKIAERKPEITGEVFPGTDLYLDVKVTVNVEIIGGYSDVHFLPDPFTVSLAGMNVLSDFSQLMWKGPFYLKK